jgi:uncharacterized protein YbjT (DUF2867 family)
VRALVRRPLQKRPSSPRLELELVAFDEPESYGPFLATDHLYCALGTTIKKAGTQEAFRKVDFELPLAAARLARQKGASHFLLVSSLGADPHARVFYSRVKGELEEAVLGLGYASVTIVRPSLLLGSRTERRPAESLAALATPLIPPRWKPVPALRVAEALVAAGREDIPGVRIIENIDLHRK